MKCLSQRYKTKISEKKLETGNKIHDIQSKEAHDRHLVFESSKTKIDCKNEEWEMAQLKLSCKYEFENVILVAAEAILMGSAVNKPPK